MTYELDGFPWCSINPDRFKYVGLQAKNLRLDQTPEFTLADSTAEGQSVEKYMRGFGPLSFSYHGVLGLYLEGHPVGVALTGVNLPARVGEVAHTYVRPNLRDFGFGSMLVDLGTLRLLHEGVTSLAAHVADNYREKIEPILTRQGFAPAPLEGDRSPHPRWARVITSPEDRVSLIRGIADNIDSKLQLREASKRDLK